MTPGAIPLTPLDLAIASGLILVLAFFSWRLHLRLTRTVLVAAVRTTVQLSLIGFVLRVLFAQHGPTWVALMAVVMVLVAGREVHARQRRRFRGGWGYGLGTLSMFVSSTTVMLTALAVIIQPEPWYRPQYAIPLLGMMLGNTMNGIALGIDRLTWSAWEQRATLEQRLMLGQDRAEASREIRRDAIRTGWIPILNSMAVAGLVSLPGMMTGQILAGSPPHLASMYQILIMFLVAGGTGLGTLVAVTVGQRRLFDERHRLRLDRLHEATKHG